MASTWYEGLADDVAMEPLKQDMARKRQLEQEKSGAANARAAREAWIAEINAAVGDEPRRSWWPYRRICSGRRVP